MSADACPTCTWPNRETVDMVCQTCGADYSAPQTPPRRRVLVAPVEPLPVPLSSEASATASAEEGVTTAHVIPVDDLVEHDADGDCVCRPTAEAVKQDDGSVVWVHTHHSLDGREASE